MNELNQTKLIGNRLCHILTEEQKPECVLIKPLGEFERLLLINECQMIKEMCNVPFVIYAFEVKEEDLREQYIEKTYNYLMEELIAEISNCYPLLPLVLGGYSLGGLFALWTSTKTDAFSAIAACSPSLWVDGWNEYADVNPPKAEYVYLSVGNREANTKKGKFACINERIIIQDKRHKQMLGIDRCKLEINEGGHFAEIEERKAKGFAWCMTKINKYNKNE